ncbi:helix-turn-helix domain-containing protein [Alistipes sp.]|uniref:helix-turn-helix domain-containing protein n=1 Tax=Alistipes sp. TaxID=1872444 RepID=UPI003076E55A
MMVEKRSYDRLVARIGALAGRVAELCRRQDKTLQHWLDNEEVCLLLNIQKRTLQRYRERGLLPCTQIRHKVYYKTADVERLLAASALRSGSKR